MSAKAGLREKESLLMMQELEDRVKEQLDKLEHVRLAVAEVRDNISGSLQNNAAELKQSITGHLGRLGLLAERVDALQMNTSVFVQMNTKPRTWSGQQGFRHSPHVQSSEDAQSECGWYPTYRRRNSDAASEMSCAW